MAPVKNSSRLFLFQTKLEEAVRLIPKMCAKDKQEVMNIWNVFSIEIQELVNSGDMSNNTDEETEAEDLMDLDMDELLGSEKVKKLENLFYHVSSSSSEISDQSSDDESEITYSNEKDIKVSCDSTLTENKITTATVSPSPKIIPSPCLQDFFDYSDFTAQKANFDDNRNSLLCNLQDSYDDPFFTAQKANLDNHRNSLFHNLQDSFDYPILNVQKTNLDDCRNSFLHSINISPKPDLMPKRDGATDQIQTFNPKLFDNSYVINADDGHSNYFITNDENSDVSIGFQSDMETSESSNHSKNAHSSKHFFTEKADTVPVINKAATATRVFKPFEDSDKSTRKFDHPVPDSKPICKYPAYTVVTVKPITKKAKRAINFIKTQRTIQNFVSEKLDTILNERKSSNPISIINKCTQYDAVKAQNNSTSKNIFVVDVTHGLHQQQQPQGMHTSMPNSNGCSILKKQHNKAIESGKYNGMCDDGSPELHLSTDSVHCSKADSINDFVAVKRKVAVAKKVKHQNNSTANTSNESQLSFFCKICDDRFPDVSSLTAHVKKHKEGAEIRYKCEKCLAEYSNKGNYLRHLESYSKNKLSQIDPNNVPDIDTGKYPHECHKCGIRFMRARTLQAHLAKHEQAKLYLCETCGEMLSLRAYREHQIRHQNTIYTCDECGREFKDRAYLRKHIKKQCHIRKCDKCNKTFVTSKSFEKHKIEKHSTLKRFKCCYCDEYYPDLSSWCKHIKVHKLHVNIDENNGSQLVEANTESTAQIGN